MDMNEILWTLTKYKFIIYVSIYLVLEVEVGYVFFYGDALRNDRYIIVTHLCVPH